MCWRTALLVGRATAARPRRASHRRRRSRADSPFDGGLGLAGFDDVGEAPPAERASAAGVRQAIQAARERLAAAFPPPTAAEAAECPGLLAGWLLVPEGCFKLQTWGAVAAAMSHTPAKWIHADYSFGDTREWLRAFFRQRKGGCPTHVIAALLDEDAGVPRCEVFSAAGRPACFCSLRAINYLPGHDAHDMISLRVFFDSEVVITTRHRDVQALRGARLRLHDAVERADTNPDTTLQCVALIIDDIATQAADQVKLLDDLLTEVEEDTTRQRAQNRLRRVRRLQTALATVRYTIVALRRWLLPQGDAVSRLAAEVERTAADNGATLGLPRDSGGGEVEHARAAADRLRAAADHFRATVQHLDMLQARGNLAQDEVTALQQERVNRWLVLVAMMNCVAVPMAIVSNAITLWGLSIAQSEVNALGSRPPADDRQHAAGPRG